jgi:hypothetical protein
MPPKFGIRAFLFAFVFPLLFSCDQDKADNGNNLMEIKLQEPFQQKIKLSELISIEKTLVIDSNSFLDFGEVSSIQRLGEHYVVHNAFPQTVSILDSTGKVIGQLVPDHQLRQISEVSAIDDQVIVLDRGAQMLHFYDKDLNLLKQVRIPVLAQSFKIIDSQTIALYVGNELTEFSKGKLLIYDLETEKITQDLFPISEKQRKYFNFLTQYHFVNANGKVVFWDSAMDQMYAVDKDGVKPFYHLDYGTSKLPTGYYEGLAFDNAAAFLQSMRATSYAFRHFMVLANERFMLIHYEKSGEFLTSLVDLKDGKSKNFTHFEDDIMGLDRLNVVKLSFFAGFLDQDKFVGFIPAEILEGSDLKSSKLLNAKENKANLILIGTLK